jgi:molybdopterin molybdotransferase
MNKKETTAISPEMACEIILKDITPLGDETITISEGYGRILASDIVSDINIPPFDNSAMDGYALTAASTTGASESTPVTLSVEGEVQAGGVVFNGNLSSGKAIRIMTGAPVPAKADAVTQVEYTAESDNIVSIFRETRPGDNIRRAGEDIALGQTILRRGDRLNSADIGLLASLNRKSVQVFRTPHVAIISTGDEIADPGEELKPGQIRNSNAYTLQSEIRKYNAVPHYIGIARDTVADTREKFLKASGFDVIISTGGVSMGKYDYVADVMKDINIEILIHSISMKPGKPCVFGKLGNKLFFGLPGNPVSTMISFIQFVRPALLRLMGASVISKPVVRAVLDEEIRKKPERTHFIRGFFYVKEEAVHVTTTGPQGSGILRSMHEANCLIILPADMSLAAKGSTVSIQLINHDEVPWA